MVELDIVERLRGKVRVPVNDGAGLLDGKDYFERTFPTSKAANEAADEIERLRSLLSDLVNAKALSGVRDLVAGWGGEGSEKPYRARHPDKLGATLPKTNCGAVYALDEAMQRARSILG